MRMQAISAAGRIASEWPDPESPRQAHLLRVAKFGMHKSQCKHSELRANLGLPHPSRLLQGVGRHHSQPGASRYRISACPTTPLIISSCIAAR